MERGDRIYTQSIGNVSELILFPTGDRHLCMFRRRRDEKDPMKSPDTVEMGNTESVEIVFSSLLDESSYMRGRLSWLSMAAFVSLFYPFTKEYT